MNAKFWDNKSVLITGFEGFLGSNLTKRLLGTKAKIVGLDIRTFRRDTILCGGDYKKIAVYNGDVANYALLKRILAKHSVDVVFHLAAEAIVENGLKNPRQAFKSNITGTWEVLEAARGKRHMPAVVVASSDKAYGSHEKLPYKENSPLLASHPYDVSKSCADLIAKTYAITYGLPVAITRCGNIYGPGDFNFSRIMPDAMRCLFSGKTLKLRSDGKYVRDYVYIDDITEGYLKIAESLKKKRLVGESFNLSNNSPMTVIGLLREVNRLNLCGKNLNYKVLNSARCEIKEQYLSSAKAKRILRYRPVYSLSEGLKKTAGWYFNYFSGRRIIL